MRLLFSVVIALFAMTSLGFGQLIEYTFKSSETSNAAAVFYSSLLTGPSKITILGTDSLKDIEFSSQNGGVAFITEIDFQGQKIKSDYLTSDNDNYAVFTKGLQATSSGFMYSVLNTLGAISNDFQIGFLDSDWNHIRDTLFPGFGMYYDVLESYIQENEQVVQVFNDAGNQNFIYRYDPQGNLLRKSLIVAETPPYDAKFIVIDTISYFVFKNNGQTLLWMLNRQDEVFYANLIYENGSQPLIKEVDTGVDIYLLSDSLFGSKKELVRIKTSEGIITESANIIGLLSPLSQLLNVSHNSNKEVQVVHSIRKNLLNPKYEKDSLLIFTCFDALGEVCYERTVELESDSTVSYASDLLIYTAGVVYDDGIRISKLIVNKYTMEGELLNSTILYRPGKIEIREIRHQTNGMLTLVGKNGKDGWFLGFPGEELSIKDSYGPHDKLLLYPNPAWDEIKINNSYSGEVKIYDSMGRMLNIQNVNNRSIKLDFLESGYYFLDFDNFPSLVKLQIIK